MATVRALLNTEYRSKDGTYPIIVLVTVGRKKRKIPTGDRVQEKQWKNGEATARNPDYLLINDRISEKVSRIKSYLADCDKKNRPVNMALLDHVKTSFSFCDYIIHRATQYKEKGKIVMAQKLSRFAKELRDCFRGDVFFDDLNQDKLRDYENYLISNENVENTRHRKFKFLRQFFKGAIDDGKASEPNPFRFYRIEKKPVKKEKLTEAEIKRIEDLKLKPGIINDARNLFLFSFYAKGMRFENCIFLKWSDIKDGRISYTTNKGGKHLSVKIHTRLQSILDQYPKREFVFPIVTEMPEDPWEYKSLVDSRNVIINRNLHIVTGLAEIERRVTFHIARHTFAYLLKKNTDSIHTIKDALGHSDYRTTEIYLKALDDEILDKEMGKLYGE